MIVSRRGRFSGDARFTVAAFIAASFIFVLPFCLSNLALLLILYPFSLFFTLVLGIPTFLVVKHFRVPWWLVLLIGAFLGLLASVATTHFEFPTGSIVAFYSIDGAISALVFSAIWWEGVRVKAHSRDIQVPAINDRRLIAAIASVLLLVTSYGVWRFEAPKIDRHDEQDACSFGPVTNARYRQLLDNAKLKLRTTWQRRDGTPLEVGDQLRSRIEDLSEGLTSPYERIAAMHAAMRASGGYLEGMWSWRTPSGQRVREFSKNPGEHAPDSKYVVDATYGYWFHSNFFGPFDLIDAYSTVSVDWVLYAVGKVVDKQFALRPFERDTLIPRPDYPNYIERILRLGGGGAYHYQLTGMSCPAVPSPEWIAAYDHWRTHAAQ